jgi:hypothetical protein
MRSRSQTVKAPLADPRTGHEAAGRNLPDDAGNGSNVSAPSNEFGDSSAFFLTYCGRLSLSILASIHRSRRDDVTGDSGQPEFASGVDTGPGLAYRFQSIVPFVSLA